MEVNSSIVRNDGVPSTARGLRVLLVDHDTTFLMYIASVLEQNSYKVKTTERASAALSMIQVCKDQFDLVMADINMPGMDVFTFLKQMKLHTTVPIILMSALATNAMEQWSLNNGACCFYAKPIRTTDIVSVWKYVSNNRILQRTGNTEVIELSESSQGTGDDDNKRRRMIWTPYLHNKFLEALKKLQEKKIPAYPKEVLRQMNVRDLTTRHIASHLQKHRDQIKHLQSLHGTTTAPVAGVPMSSHFQGAFTSLPSMEPRRYSSFRYQQQGLNIPNSNFYNLNTSSHSSLNYGGVQGGANYDGNPNGKGKQALGFEGFPQNSIVHNYNNSSRFQQHRQINAAGWGANTLAKASTPQITVPSSTFYNLQTFKPKFGTLNFSSNKTVNTSSHSTMNRRGVQGGTNYNGNPVGKGKQTLGFEGYPWNSFGQHNTSSQFSTNQPFTGLQAMQPQLHLSEEMSSMNNVFRTQNGEPPAASASANQQFGDDINDLLQRLEAEGIDLTNWENFGNDITNSENSNVNGVGENPSGAHPQVNGIEGVVGSDHTGNSLVQQLEAELGPDFGESFNDDDLFRLGDTDSIL